MSYSPKHPTKADASAAEGKKKPIALIALIIGAVVIAAVLLIVFLPGRGSGSQTQDGTTLVSPYYVDGVLPTTGARHDVTVIEGGGADGAKFTGKWALDEVTIYLFDGKGRGVMLTAVDNYTFMYSAQDGKLDIDFDTDDAMDGEYSYSIAGSRMVLTRGGQTYNFTKQQ